MHYYRQLLIVTCLTLSPLLAQAQDNSLEKTINDANTIFQLLTSEIAAQRGYVDLSGQARLELARQNRDPVLAKQVLEDAFKSNDYLLALEALYTLHDFGIEDVSHINATYSPLLEQIQSHSIDIGKQLNQRLKNTNNFDLELDRIHYFLLRYTLGIGLKARPLSPEQLQPLLHQTFLSFEKKSQPLNIQAILYSVHSQHDLALKAAEASLKIDPSNELAATIRLEALGTKSVTKGIKLTKEFLKRNHGVFPELKIVLARFLIQKRQINDAQKIINELTAILPNNAEVLFLQGLIHIENNQLTEAETLLETVLKRQPMQVLGSIIRPDFVEDLLLRIWLQKKEYDKAKVLLERSPIKSFKRDGYRIKIELAHQNFTNAKALFSNLKPTSPEERLVAVELAIELVTEDKTSQAEKTAILLETLERYISDPSDYLAISIALNDIGNEAAMEQTLKTFLEKFPDHRAEGLNTLGYTLIHNPKRVDEAALIIKEAFSLSPNNPAIQDSMGWALFKQGHYTEALVLLKKAYSQLKDPVIAAHIAEVLWHIDNNNKEVEKFMRAAIRLDPSNKEVLETLERLNLSRLVQP